MTQRLPVGYDQGCTLKTATAIIKNLPKIPINTKKIIQRQVAKEGDKNID